MLSLVLAPVRTMAAGVPCSEPEPATMECGGCCEAMACCVQEPEQPIAPAIPSSSQHAASDFSVALMAATRPLLWILPSGDHDFVSTASVPFGRSRDSLALLCIRLI